MLWLVLEGLCWKWWEKRQTQTTFCILKTVSYWNFVMILCLTGIRNNVDFLEPHILNILRCLRCFPFWKAEWEWTFILRLKIERKLEWSFVIGLYLQLTMKSQHLQKPTVLWVNLNGISLQYSINWILNRYSNIILCTWLLNVSNAFESMNLLGYLFSDLKKNTTCSAWELPFSLVWS